MIVYATLNVGGLRPYVLAGFMVLHVLPVWPCFAAFYGAMQCMATVGV